MMTSLLIGSFLLTQAIVITLVHKQVVGRKNENKASTYNRWCDLSYENYILQEYIELAEDSESFELASRYYDVVLENNCTMARLEEAMA